MPSLNDETLALMESLGHSRQAGMKALDRFPNDPDRAFGWLMDQDTIDDVGPTPPTPPFRLSPQLSSRPDGDTGDGSVTGDTAWRGTRDAPIDLVAVNSGLTGLTEDDELRMAMEASLRESEPPASIRHAATGVYGASSGWSSGFGGPSPSRSTNHLPQQLRPLIGQRHSGSSSDNGTPEHKEFATADGFDVGPADRAMVDVEDPYSNNPFKASMKSNLGTFHKVNDSKVDDGSMGVVVAGQPPNGFNVSFDDNLPPYHSPTRLPPPPPPPPPTHKEDTDLERALALSMMDVTGGAATDPLDGMNDLEMRDVEVKGMETSAGLVPEGMEDRADGAPMLYRVTDYAAGFIGCMFQCLLATPQMRLFLERLPVQRAELPSKAQSAIKFMQTLLRISTTFKAPYIDVDTSQLVDMDLCNYTMSLPLSDRLKETLDVLSMFCECIADEATSDASSLGDIESQSSEPDRFSTSLLPSKPSADNLQYQRYLKQPSSLLQSSVGPVHSNDSLWRGTMCPLVHDAAHDSHIMQCISRAVWAQDSNQMIHDIAAIFSIGVKKAPRPFGEGVVGVMKLEEELYMDRFLMSNAAKSIETRGQENWRKGEMTRCEETLAELSTFKNRSIEQSIDAIIAHYESGEAVKGEEEEKRQKVSGEMVEILLRVKTSMAAKREELQASIKVLRKEIDEIWDIPELKKHRYLLRGVSYYVGFDSPTAYHTYVRQEDGKWWKLAQSGATETTFSTIVEDATGLHYDQGPFFMTYSRDGPSPCRDTLLPVTSDGRQYPLQPDGEEEVSPSAGQNHAPALTTNEIPISDRSTPIPTLDDSAAGTSNVATPGNSTTTPSDTEMKFNDDISAPSQIVEFDVTHLDSALKDAPP